MLRGVSVLLFLAGGVCGLDFQPCRTFLGIAVGKPPLTAEIDGCSKPPCTFVRGTNISGTMTFTADRTLSVLEPEVTVYVLHAVPVNFPIKEKDACSSLVGEAQCPLKKGQTATYKYSMFLEDTTPLVRPLMRYAFRDQRGRVAICAEVPIVIVDKNGRK